MQKKVILSVDGGGIRGIIPLCALIELERQTGKPTREVVSLVAGTSTGAIIAGALAMGLSATRVLALYQEAGPSIFRMDYLNWVISGFSYRYKTKPMADLIRKYLNSDPILNESPIDIMLTSTCVEDGKNWYFVRDNPGNAKSTGKLKLVDCITASAAAPTYFEPWPVAGIGACVDGGAGVASNPVYQAAVEAFYYTSPAYTPDHSVIISLGTGFYPSKNSPHNIVDWLKFTIGELLEAPSTQQNAIVYRHFPEAHSYRWNPQLPREIDMDAVSEIPALIEIGTKMAQPLNWKAMLNGTGTDHKVGPNTRGMGRN